MKIGFVLDDGLDATDGVQQYVLTLGTWLLKQGHDVHYLVGQTVRDDIPNIHSLGKNLTVRFNGNRLSIPFSSSKKKIVQLLQQEQFDVLHVQMPYSPQLAGKVISAAPQTTAVVGTFHILPYGRVQAAATWGLSKVVAPSLRRFDSIVTVSTAAQGFAQKYMNITSSVVPNAVSLAKFAKGARKKKSAQTRQRIIFLGRLVPRKGCIELLQAVDQLVDVHKITDFEVVIAGHGQQRAKIEEFIAEKRLSDYVSMSGWLTEADKPHFLSNADIAVFPSIAGESFGIVLVEAIAAGAGVVLGGDNPGYRYVLEDEEALVSPKDTNAFAERLRALLQDPKLRSRLQKAQQKRIEAFDVAVVGTQIEHIYQREIAKRAKKSDNGNK